ncbi:MAG: DUF1858 domain-containing protein [Mobilitalea sp.]
MKRKHLHTQICACSPKFASREKGMVFKMKVVDKNMVISEILMIESGLTPILMASGMHCLGCHSSQFETLEEACFVHGIDVDNMVDKLNEYLVLLK